MLGRSAKVVGLQYPALVVGAELIGAQQVVLALPVEREKLRAELAEVRLRCLKPQRRMRQRFLGNRHTAHRRHAPQLGSRVYGPQRSLIPAARTASATRSLVKPVTYRSQVSLLHISALPPMPTRTTADPGSTPAQRRRNPGRVRRF